MDGAKVIWLIDENENQSRTYARKLKRELPDLIIVRRLFPPFAHLSEYGELLNDSDSVCIIVDQKLKDTGIATYTGIELAEYLRGINSKIPIYILTNFPELQGEYESGEWSVEDIIDKDIFSSPQKLQTLIARLLRRLDIYIDISDDRAERFKILLHKKVVGKLSAEEEREFVELQFSRLGPSEATEQMATSELQELINLNQQLLNRLSTNPKNTDE